MPCLVAALLILAFAAQAQAFPGANGKIAFTSLRDGNEEIYAMNADGGAQTRLTNSAGFDRLPAWSADGRRIAFASERNGNSEIYAMNADGGAQTRLTNHAGVDSSPAFSPDGGWIAFTSSRSGKTEIWVTRADGTGTASQLTTTPGSSETGSFGPAWSPDGQRIAFHRGAFTDSSQIYVMNANGTGATQVTTVAGGNRDPAWSPDGNRIAFTSGRDGGTDHGYVMNANGTGQTRLTTATGSYRNPAWSPDGSRIALGGTVSGNQDVYSIAANGTGQARLTDHAAFDGNPDWQPLDPPPPPPPPPSPPPPPPPPSPPPAPLEVRDTQIDHVEVTQAVQPTFGRFRSTPTSFGWDWTQEAMQRSRWYQTFDPFGRVGEVPLAADLRTVVRVYASLHRGAASTRLRNVPATLEAVGPGGRSLGAIQSHAPPVLRVDGNGALNLSRLGETSAYTFTLPASWTKRGRIDLVARVNPAGTGLCGGPCRARSTYRLNGVAFQQTRVLHIVPAALVDGGQYPTAVPGPAFDAAVATTPLKIVRYGYHGVAEVGDLLRKPSVTVRSCFIVCGPKRHYEPHQPEFRASVQGDLMDRLIRASGQWRAASRVVVGLIRPPRDGEHGMLPGAMRGRIHSGLFQQNAIGYAATHRPTSAIAHEVQHALGRPHASTACGGNVADTDPWPPDEQGRLQGFGLDTRTGSGRAGGPYAAAKAPTHHDMMSYCASEDNAWISPYGWYRMVSRWVVGDWVASAAAATASTEAATPAAGASQAAGKALRVTAVEFDSGELAITGLSPATAAERGPVASPYVLEAVDRGGRVLASAGAAGDELSDTGSALISGTVPAPAGTARVQVRREGGPAAFVDRSANRPSVRLTAPRPGSRIGGRTVTVRYRTADRDRDDLTAAVEYSADGGRTWRLVHVGPGTGRASFPRALLAGSQGGRLRVRVDDGFNQSTATSGRLAVASSPPRVRITEPRAGKLQLRADATVQLTGEGLTATGRPLPARALRWTAAGKRLGRGPSVALAGLEPGRHRLILSATHSGRTARDSLQVTVQAVKPEFLRLSAPARIGRKARSLRLTVASTVGATLRVQGSAVRGSKPVKISPRSRRVAVPLRPGAGRTQIHLQLRAGRHTTQETVTITRR